MTDHPNTVYIQAAVTMPDGSVYGMGTGVTVSLAGQPFDDADEVAHTILTPALAACAVKIAREICP
jgi:hypothetical protein